MDPIYVTGHRNPDTDSIVAAIAYAALRNACGDREYEAACLGQVSEETRIVLDRFGFRPPTRISDLYNQVRDLDFDTPPILNTGVTVGRAWEEFQQYPTIAAVPVARVQQRRHYISEWAVTIIRAQARFFRQPIDIIKKRALFILSLCLLLR